jgi:hypothetical protein
MGKRLHLPAKLRRRILVEAGHRCAIPTCRLPTTEVAHIKPWKEVKEHKYENLIALCPNCHKRAERGEIDRKSLRIYKRILQRLTDRYTKFELIVLNELRLKKPVVIATPMLLLIKNILDEKLVEVVKEEERWVSGSMGCSQVSLTERGHQFFEEWIEAKKDLTY